MSGANLFEQQRTNRRRSAVLVAIFLLFFAWIGFGGDYILYLSTMPAAAPAARGGSRTPYHHTFPWFGLGTTLLGIGMAWYGWRNGAKQVLWASGAWELVQASKPDEQQLVNVVEEMAIASGIPKPKVWIVPDKDPNAFATGTDERHAHIAVTEGLLTTLNRDELQAVIGHELAHIKNYDVKLMTLLAALVGVLALISEGTWRFLGRGGGRVAGRSSGGGRKGGGGLVVVLLVLWLISVLLAPIVSRLLALAVSRKREFLADASSAQFTRNPAALAAALRKIEDAAAPTAAIHRGCAHLCIADPLGRRINARQGFVADVFGTHPPMAVRIARLKAMAYQYEKTGVMPGTA
ncbi:MAG TPA: M48 family metallopeptidase [Gemmatimonadales bacterium]|nr:M48 family metallopeptidase [Gemmatimonadales bacterium]